ncbi:MAG: formate dehydrogenase accessory sulfurtransferase FdhD [Bacteroidetes bacterium]|nr:MAG: formate dehydrogenase accessory sulfurtransferase FdhD [Bacteroidota bacterium]
MDSGHIQKIDIIRINQTSVVEKKDMVAVEEPMEIRLIHGNMDARQRKRLTVTMRTPGDDFELASGFLFSEGIIKDQKDILQIEHCPNEEADTTENVVRVTLSPEVFLDAEKLDRNFYTSSACGLCGKTSIEAIFDHHTPTITRSEIKITPGLIYSLIQKSKDQQLTFYHTGGLHAAALFDSSGNLELIREDIGRHNAVDKVIGAALVGGNRFPLSNHILLLSGRAGFELIQKATFAGIQVVAAVGAPSSLAIELAEESGMTLIGFLREGRFNVYSGKERLTMDA